MAISKYAVYHNKKVYLKPEFFKLMLDHAQVAAMDDKYWSTEDMRRILDHVDSKLYGKRCDEIETFFKVLFGR